jgi:hypothetical protein
LSIELLVQRSEKFATLLWLLSLLAVCFFVLWLPVFPTGDGPIHLYIAHIFVQLVLDPDSKFSTFYSIRHVVQPYCLMYYLIAVLETVLSPNWAEKILICITVLIQGFGYLVLAKALGRNGTLAAFLIIPLLIGFPLGAGFVNFCISLGITYFALSLWIQMDEGPRGWKLTLFTLSTLLVLLTHPVPLLILAGYIAGDLVLRFFMIKSQPPVTLWPAHKPHCIALFVVILAILGPALLAKGQPTHFLRNFHPLYLARGIRDLKFLVISDGSFAAAYAYRLTVYAGLFFALFFGVRRFVHHAASRSFDTADRFFLLSLFLFAVIPLLPLDIGGGFFFAERMVDIAWPLTLISLATVECVPRYSRVLSLALVSVVLLSIYTWAREFKPIAKQVVVFSNLPIAPDSPGIFLGLGTYQNAHDAGFTYPVTVFAGVRALLTHNDILLNTPWMDQPIIPLKPSPNSDIAEFDPRENFWNLLEALKNDPQLRDKILKKSRFIIFQDIYHQSNSPLSELTAFLGPDSLRNWHCQDGEIYALCLKKPAPSLSTGQ